MGLSLRNIGYHCRIGSSSLLGEMTLAVLIFMGDLMFSNTWAMMGWLPSE